MQVSNLYEVVPPILLELGKVSDDYFISEESE